MLIVKTICSLTQAQVTHEMQCSRPCTRSVIPGSSFVIFVIFNGIGAGILTQHFILCPATDRSEKLWVSPAPDQVNLSTVKKIYEPLIIPSKESGKTLPDGPSFGNSVYCARPQKVV